MFASSRSYPGTFTVREMSPAEQQKYGKRFEAIMPRADAGSALRRFGSPGAQTYIDGASEDKKRGYLARHGAPSVAGRQGEDWEASGRGTPGWLSRWLLWGPSRSLASNARKKGGKLVT